MASPRWGRPACPASDLLFGRDISQIQTYRTGEIREHSRAGEVKA
jgi:hypothetical protein